MTKVFISGSISIKKLPSIVMDSLDKIVKNNFTVLVGDAKGIDTEVQKYLIKKNYFNVKVYSIYYESRNNLSDKFQAQTVNVEDSSIRSERERQKFKDIRMTEECDYGLVIWDEESKGSYENILRLIQLNKSFKVYTSKKENFLTENEKTKENIELLFNTNNGLSASEVAKELNNRDIFFSARDVNKYLIENKIVYKANNCYLPMKGKEHFVIVKNSKKGKQSRYTVDIINYIEEKIYSESLF